MSKAYFTRIERKYGLTQEAFLKLLTRQKSRCAACDRQFVLFSSNRAECPVVDHNHVTGEVRGLLCTGCNVAVGYMEKDSYRTYRAALYLASGGTAHKSWARARRVNQKAIEAVQPLVQFLQSLQPGRPPGKAAPATAAQEKQAPERRKTACDAGQKGQPAEVTAPIRFKIVS